LPFFTSAGTSTGLQYDCIVLTLYFDCSPSR
jgi:hypothetical protein